MYILCVYNICIYYVYKICVYIMCIKYMYILCVYNICIYYVYVPSRWQYTDAHLPSMQKNFKSSIELFSKQNML